MLHGGGVVYVGSLPLPRVYDRVNLPLRSCIKEAESLRKQSPTIISFVISLRHEV